MRSVVTAALLAVFVAGCASVRPQPSPEVAALPTSQQLLKALEGRRSQLRGLRSIARLRYRSPGTSESARHALAVERPDRLRFEVLSVLGSMFVLASDRGSFTAWVPSESTVYRGAATPANLAPYLPAGVTVPAIVDHILATPPVDLSAPSSVVWDHGLIRLTQADGGGSRSVWFLPPDLPANYREIDRDGHTTIEVTYDQVDTARPVALARRITFRFPQSEELLEVSLRDPEVNPALPPEYFRITPPREARQVDLDSARL